MDGIETADSDLYSTRIGGLSPVNGTDVPTLLRNLGAKTVVIAGVSTNVAIPNATLDCVNFGFNVVIPRDAITGYPVDYTDVIIKNTLSLVAKITTTDELVELWSLEHPSEGELDRFGDLPEQFAERPLLARAERRDRRRGGQRLVERLGGGAPRPRGCARCDGRDGHRGRRCARPGLAPRADRRCR